MNSFSLHFRGYLLLRGAIRTVFRLFLEEVAVEMLLRERNQLNFVIYHYL